MSGDPIAFAEARLAEDEAGAYGLCGNGPLARWLAPDGEFIFLGNDPFPNKPIARAFDERVTAHITRHDPARVLREVEAGRRILERHRDCEPFGGGPCDHAGIVTFEGLPCPDMRDLLARWSDHPDYRQEWAPHIALA